MIYLFCSECFDIKNSVNKTSQLLQKQVYDYAIQYNDLNSYLHETLDMFRVQVCLGKLRERGEVFFRTS